MAKKFFLMCRIYQYSQDFSLIFFKGWLHLVAFINNYTHLYELIYMQLYNTQHAYNLLQNTRYVKPAMYGLNIPYHEFKFDAMQLYFMAYGLESLP